MARELVRLEVKGLRETAAALKALPDRIMRRTLIAATITAAKEFQQELYRTAPHRTGRLVSEIGISQPRIRRGNVKIDVGPSKKALYAYFLEYGTSRMAARPFMRPAFDAAHQDALDEFSERLKRDLPDDVRAIAAPEKP